MKTRLCVLVLLGLTSVELPAALLGSSVADFSGTQGQAGWHYGYWNATTDADGIYDPSEFTPFPASAFVGAWDLASGIPPWTAMTATSASPNGPDDGDAHWAVRRFVLPSAGPVQITGELKGIDAFGGDGVFGRILVDGVEEYTQFLGANNITGYLFDFVANASIGSNIDFVVDPIGTTDSDWTTFTAEISNVPIPAALPLFLSSLFGVFAVAGRKSVRRKG